MIDYCEVGFAEEKELIILPEPFVEKVIHMLKDADKDYMQFALEPFLDFEYMDYVLKVININRNNGNFSYSYLHKGKKSITIHDLFFIIERQLELLTVDGEKCFLKSIRKKQFANTYFYLEINPIAHEILNKKEKGIIIKKYNVTENEGEEILTMVIIKDVCKVFHSIKENVTALTNVNLKINKGITVISGVSDSGKSTLLHIIGCFVRPTSGTIIVMNTDLSILDDKELLIFRRRQIGFISNEYFFDPVLNIYDNIVFMSEIDKREPDEDYIRKMARILNVEDKLLLYPDGLSDGEKQKIAVLRALAIKPAVVLIDEPKGGIDLETNIKMVELLKYISLKFQPIIIIATKNEKIVDIANKVVYIDKGFIIEKVM